MIIQGDLHIALTNQFREVEQSNISSFHKINFLFVIVSFDSDGALLIPVNTQRTINCSCTEDLIINSWFVILNDGTEVGAIAAQGNVQRFGITGIFMMTLVQLIVNTSNTSIVGLRCVGVVFNDATEIIRSEAKINLTIYGKYLILCYR